MVSGRPFRIHYEKWDEISYLFTHCNGCAVEVWEWISNLIPHLTGHVIRAGMLIHVSKVSKKDTVRLLRSDQTSLLMVQWYLSEENVFLSLHYHVCSPCCLFILLSSGHSKQISQCSLSYINQHMFFFSQCHWNIHLRCDWLNCKRSFNATNLWLANHGGRS